MAAKHEPQRLWASRRRRWYGCASVYHAFMAVTVSTYNLQLPREASFEEVLAGITTTNKNEFVAAMKAARTDLWQRIHEDLVENVNELTGFEVTARLSAAVDSILSRSMAFAVARTEAPADWADELGIFALGGYGRGELNPQSDLDVMLIFRTADAPAWVATLAEEFQTLLWDLGFQIGASARSLPELQAIIGHDFVTATALLEQRPVEAGQAVVDGVTEVLTWFKRKRLKPFIAYKIEELDERREKAGDSSYVLEPNLKTGPGGLRDIQLLRNMCFIVFGSRAMTSLTEFGSFRHADVQHIVEVNDVLIKMRSFQHFHHGHRQDQMTLTDQVRVAAQLGYQDGGPLRNVERMMQDLYFKVRHVQNMVELCRARLHALGHHGRNRFIITTRRKLCPGFVVISGKVFSAERDFWDKPDPFVRLVEMFEKAQERGARTGFELVRTIQSNLHRFRVSLRHDERIVASLRRMLRRVGRLYPVFSDMHACGLLGAILPEFGNITCHVQFNSYHHYTVDEHTLIALRVLDDVFEGREPGLAGMTDIIRSTPHRDVLSLALIMHDVGKYMGGGHVQRGALMVAPVADRFGLSDTEQELLHFLVLEHVTLSDASRMRDIQDPDLLVKMAAQMGSIERLDLLYALTFADARAVGPGIMTGWQAELLEQLRRNLVDVLSGRIGDEPVNLRQRLHARLVEEGVAAADADAFLDDLGETYVYQASPDRVGGHHACWAAANQAGDRMAVRHRMLEKGMAIQVVLPDQNHLLRALSAVLCGHALDISATRAWTTTSGLILMMFEVEAVVPERWTEASRWKRFESDVRACLDGSATPQSFIEQRRSMLVVEKPADSGFDDVEVRIEQKTSDRATILDVKARDRIGLLTMLCEVIDEFGCSIDYACIDTRGDIAIDVFYLTLDEEKLPVDKAKALRSMIIERLAAQPA